MSIRSGWWKQQLWGAMVLVCTLPVGAASLTVDHDQVSQWNRFADALFEIHQARLTQQPVRRDAHIGGYANNPSFYREVSYRNADSGQLLSRIRWEVKNPSVIHSIEVYEYADDGQVAKDYLAAYLPVHRNAPIQTLINVHHHEDRLHAFRQFDASGVRIYEQCKGHFFDEPVMVSLDEDELPIHIGAVPEDVGDALYSSCFASLPKDVDDHLSSLLKSTATTPTPTNEDNQRAQIESDIELLTSLIGVSPDVAQWYLDRGRSYFILQDFDRSMVDLDEAIRLDARLDDAWFWRGMARGRAGLVKEGIADLDVFISRNPGDSHAYTKRGVRYIWLGQLERAQQDLLKAVSLDSQNAEAHDDLGVIYAQKTQLKEAEKHFKEAISHDPSYQKAYHNLAMVKYMTGEHATALARVEDALRLAPESRNGMLLKASILQAMGRTADAAAINEQAEFMPEGNWSERLKVGE